VRHRLAENSRKRLLPAVLTGSLFDDRFVSMMQATIVTVATFATIVACEVRESPKARVVSSSRLCTFQREVLIRRSVRERLD
jgi:hypothetical protein